jgi:flagellin-like hook-associated protein FlgL
MGVNDITLSGNMRNNLTNLQTVSMLQARTSLRLSTGLKVNSAVDDPSAYFAAQNNRSRANDLDARKAAMGEAIQTVKSADEGIKAITSLIEQAKGLAASARSAGTTDAAALATQFNNLLSQITNIATDATYKGKNLLNGDTVTVQFNESGSSSLDIVGFSATAAGLSVNNAVGNWATSGNIDTAVTALDTALTTLRNNSKSLSSNLGVVSSRQDFTTGIVNALTEGADNLTAADTNAEGANMLALQTRQQLGITALSLSNQAQQGILRLFG